jgi:hypothetical protein
MGVSFAEYIRRLVLRDLGEHERAVSPRAIFNLGSSGGSDIRRHKDKMIAAAVAGAKHKGRQRL